MRDAGQPERSRQPGERHRNGRRGRGRAGLPDSKYEVRRMAPRQELGSRVGRERHLAGPPALALNDCGRRRSEVVAPQRQRFRQPQETFQRQPRQERQIGRGALEGASSTWRKPR
jgi:hypothetical protein